MQGNNITIDVVALVAVMWASLEVFFWRLRDHRNGLLVLELGLLYAVVLRALLLYQAVSGWQLPNSVELFSMFYVFLAFGLYFLRRSKDE
jgi:hypothetical protein